MTTELRALAQQILDRSKAEGLRPATLPLDRLQRIANTIQPVLAAMPATAPITRARQLRTRNGAGSRPAPAPHEERRRPPARRSSHDKRSLPRP